MEQNVVPRATNCYTLEMERINQVAGQAQTYVTQMSKGLCH